MTFTDNTKFRALVNTLNDANIENDVLETSFRRAEAGQRPHIPVLRGETAVVIVKGAREICASPWMQSVRLWRSLETGGLSRRRDMARPGSYLLAGHLSHACPNTVSTFAVPFQR